LKFACKLTSKKYAKTFNFLCAGNKDFVKYQAQEGDFNPNPPLAYDLENVTLVYARMEVETPRTAIVITR